ncbi:tetratricopeptide repeat protein [Candidatus Sumerlaeota bacterium]|nr:tetratricopeptide repeat protein [Candidatus Sumerlaeota bacterium]
MAESPFGRQATFRSLWWIFTGKAHPLNAAYPVFQASWFLDILVFRRDPHLSHLLNLVLHLVNVAFVWQCSRLLLLRSLGQEAPRPSRGGGKAAKRGSRFSDSQVLLAAAVGATLFGVHPVNVEPVAWVSGRKVELALFFSLAALVLLLSRRGGWLRYVSAVLSYGLALLSNATCLGMSLVFGAWLTIVERVRFPRAFLLALPFLLLALWFGATRSALDKAQWERAGDLNLETSNRDAPLGAHFAARARETLDLFRPRGLVPVYPVAKPPYWTFGSFAGIVLMAGSALLVVWGWGRGVSGSDQSDRAALRKVLAFGLAWYWLVLGPAFLHHRIQADRHLYISTVGLFMAFGVLSAVLLGRLRPPARSIATAVYVAAGLALSIVAFRQAGHWRTSKSLFRHAIAVTRDNQAAHMGLGAVLGSEGDFDGAIPHLRAALDLAPSSAEGHRNLGIALLGAGEIDRAIAEFSRAIEIRPDYAEAHGRLGAALVRTGRWSEAIPHCEFEVRANPQSAQAQLRLAIAFGATGRLEEARGRCEAALRIEPDYAEAEGALGNVLVGLGRIEEAIRRFERALSLKPDYAEAENGLAGAFVLAGRLHEAVAHYEAALRIDPGLAVAEYNLANVLLQLGRAEEAIPHYEAVGRLQPGSARAQSALDRIRRIARGRE